MRLLSILLTAGALWGAIGAAGSEMLMEAVYDPASRSRALIAEMADDLREGRIQLSGDNQMAELRQTFEDRLRRDVQQTRDIVRTGMAFTSLVLGAQSREINILDDTAYRAVTHNFLSGVIPLGTAALEAAGPSLLAAAGAGLSTLGITYMWNEASRDTLPSDPVPPSLGWEYGADVSLMLEDGHGNSQSGHIPGTGQGTSASSGGMLPEDPDHENRNEECRDNKSQGRNKNKKPEKEEHKDFSQGTKDLLGGSNRYKDQFFERRGQPKNATSLRAANIESRGGQIDLAIERQIEMDHITKVQKAQKGLGDFIQSIKQRLGHPRLPMNERVALQEELSKASKLLDHTVKFIRKPPNP